MWAPGPVGQSGAPFGAQSQNPHPKPKRVRVLCRAAGGLGPPKFYPAAAATGSGAVTASGGAAGASGAGAASSVFWKLARASSMLL